MPQDNQARSYLWDIRNAAHEINTFMRGVKYAEIDLGQTTGR